MVKYTISKYNANPDRVYASGTSSGAMMTEALLATYPDVFKGGVEFAGVPAGCWAVGASADGTWSGPCAGGQVTHTAAEWGDIARKMYPA
jgi:acetylxylan esterase